mgnify:CR=1 FL=1
MIYREEVPTKLKDTLHTCLRCGQPAHECEEGVYRCDDSTCGFVWKVVTCAE